MPNLQLLALTKQNQTYSPLGRDEKLETVVFLRLSGNYVFPCVYIDTINQCGMVR